MSLEEQVGGLRLAVEALTDAVLQACSLMRQAPVSDVERATAMTTVPDAPTQAATRGRGRPPKNPPPAPMDLAAAAAPTPSAGSTTSAAPSAAAVTPAQPPAGAPAAGGGSPAVSPSGATPDEVYATLRGLVLEAGEKLGMKHVAARAATMGIVKNWQELKTDTAKMEQAIELFRGDLEGPAT